MLPAFILLSALCAPALRAQTTALSSDGAASNLQHEHMQMNMTEPDAWQFMQDGILRLMFNHQGSDRGGDEFVAPNWWMGMARRPFKKSAIQLTGMFSLDPATVGQAGYREIFQAGEALNGEPLVDRQHPHDFFMQLSAAWTRALTDRTSLTIAGAPVGEPALGPIAFMHRPSAAALPLAPLSHHTFDSTHIAFGVVTAAVEHGPVTVEGSVFNGREPDQNRWDFDFAPLDSLSARLWYRPAANWSLQVSTGHLVHPEALEPGNIQRTTASLSWFRPHGDDFGAVTIGYGVNATDEGARNAVFVEASRARGDTVVSARLEVLQVETNVLLNHSVPTGEDAAAKDPVGALTVGLTRNVVKWHRFEAAIGGAFTLNAVPEALREDYGRHPASFQLFLQIRPPVGRSGRMWNMRMGEPMGAHKMTMP